MVFAGTAAFALGAVTTVGGAMAVGVGAAGLGLSAASAAGAFNSDVESQGPTQAELEAAKYARQAFGLGQKIQRPLDQMAREDLRYLGSGQAMDAAGDAGVNQAWSQIGGQLGSGLQSVAARSGGPGSGQYWGQMGRGASALEAGLQQANLQGRLGGMNQYLGRQQQFLGRRVDDLNEGLGMMTSGGIQAQQNKQNRISAQIANNVAKNQAMGQIGGAMTSVGMMGLSAAGGAAGGATTAPSMAGAMNPTAGAPYGGYVFTNPAL